MWKLEVEETKVLLASTLTWIGIMRRWWPWLAINTRSMSLWKKCWSTSKHNSYNVVVEQTIRGPTTNHTLKNSRNWQDVQGQMELQ
jgi:hypothetical protein